MDKFYSTLFSAGHSQAGSPIYLGQDNGVLYFLQPEIVSLNELNYLDDPRKSHPYIIEMQTVTRQQPPFRYGFCLGTLRYTYQESGGSSGGGDTKSPARLPFHVYLDVGSADKDIWIVFTTSFLDSMGEPVPLGARTNPWDYLLSPQTGRQFYRAFKINKLGKLFTPDQNQPFFNQAIGGNGFQTLLLPYAADKDEVIKNLQSAK
jgi:hypothetical protein